MATTPPVPLYGTFHYRLTSTNVDPDGKTSISNATWEVVATGNASFAGRTGLTRLEFIDPGESGDAFSQYVGFTAAGNVIQERIFGASQQMPAEGGTLTATVTFPEGEILDEFPEAAGLHWNGLATEKDDLAIVAPSYRFESTETVNTDGSSSYAFHEAGNVSTDGGTRVVRSDGSARSDYRRTGSFEEVDTIGLPQAAGGHYVIPITTSGGNPSANATPAPAKTVDVPDWYPSHALAPRPLVSESVTNEGRSAIPGVCGRTGPAFRLHMTYASLDPYAGTESKGLDDEYDVPGLGNVCTVETFADFYVPDHGIGGTGAVTSLGTGVIVTILTSESGLRPLLAGEPSAAPVSAGALRRFLQTRRHARPYEATR